MRKVCGNCRRPLARLGAPLGFIALAVFLCCGFVACSRWHEVVDFTIVGPGDNLEDANR